MGKASILSYIDYVLLVAAFEAYNRFGFDFQWENGVI